MRKQFGFHENEVVRIAREAGDAIMAQLADTATLGIESKSDDSPVTEADKRAHAIIMQLGEKNPDGYSLGEVLTLGIPVMSEEMPLEQQQAIMKCNEYWCVDPLDGTRTAVEYSKGHKENVGFGVLIALIRDGKPVFGVAHYPAQGALGKNGKPVGVTYYTSADGKKAYRQEGEAPRARIRTTLAHDPLVAACGYRGVAPQQIAGKCVTNRPDVGGSRIIRTAEGVVDVGYMGNDGPISFGFWDLAAPHAILKAAGGQLVTLSGALSDHAQPDILKQSEVVRYDGSHWATGAQGKPYLPACMAAGRDTLRYLGGRFSSREIGS